MGLEPGRPDLVPVRVIGLDGGDGTYHERAADHSCIVRVAVDEERPWAPSADMAERNTRDLQPDLRSGQSDHRPRFGPFPGHWHR